MPDEIIVATPPGTGDGTEIPTQATSPSATQADAEPQTPGAGQVEPAAQTPQEPDASRRRPSDFYRERQRIRRMEEAIQTLAQNHSELLSFLKNQRPSDAPQTDGQFDAEKFFTDPRPTLTTLEKRLLAEINKVREETQGFRQEMTRAESDRKRQEALELLFPKSSPDSEESLEVRVNKDPERTERILEILKEPGVIQLFEANPQRALRFIQGEAGEAQQAKPTVIPKKLMGGTAKGNPAIGGKRTMTEDDLRAELKKLRDEADKNPSLRTDAEFRRRRSQVIGDLERLMTEEKRG